MAGQKVWVTVILTDNESGDHVLGKSSVIPPENGDVEDLKMLVKASAAYTPALDNGVAPIASWKVTKTRDVKDEGLDPAQPLVQVMAQPTLFVLVPVDPKQAARASQTSLLREARRPCNPGEHISPTHLNGSDYLLSLPSSLLGRAWPSARVVLGRRVCKQLHRDLLDHVDSVLLVQAELCSPISRERLAEDFVRMTHLAVTLKWRDRPDALLPVLPVALVHLDLSGCRMNEDDAETLAPKLLRCTALAHLDLGTNMLGPAGVEHLASVLGKCSAMTALSLRHNYIRAEGTMVGMTHLSRGLAECKRLQQLDLSSNSLSAQGVGMLLDAPVECSGLTRLDLGGSALGRGGTANLERLLREAKGLRHLELRSNNIEGEGLADLSAALGECKGLAYLGLMANSLNGAEGMARLGEVLCRLPALTALNMNGNALRCVGAARLAEGLRPCARLRRIDLSNCGIGDAGVGRLSDALPLHSSLARLDLSHNQLGGGDPAAPRAPSAGVRALVERCGALRHLDLRANSLRDAEWMRRQGLELLL